MRVNHDASQDRQPVEEYGSALLERAEGGLMWPWWVAFSCFFYLGWMQDDYAWIIDAVGWTSPGFVETDV